MVSVAGVLSNTNAVVVSLWKDAGKKAEAELRITSGSVENSDWAGRSQASGRR